MSEEPTKDEGKSLKAVPSPKVDKTGSQGETGTVVGHASGLSAFWQELKRRKVMRMRYHLCGGSCNFQDTATTDGGINLKTAVE